MKKSIAALFAAFLLVGISAQAQNIMTRNGHIWFFSSTPVEDIEAHNYQVNSVMNPETGEMVFSLLMKSFQFEKALMQEHFNEKYVESDKYPKATFKGKVTNMNGIDLTKDGNHDVSVAGQLNIHGVTQSIDVNGTLKVEAGAVSAKAEFPITVADYKIKIPKLVEENIAKVITAFVEMKYEPLQK